MRTIRVYCPLPLQVGSLIELPQEQANHVCKVLRLRKGDTIHLFDGKGNEFQASLENVEKRKAEVKIIVQVVNHTESNIAVHLGQVISRGDRMDYAVQKAVELGVSEITPLFSDRCEVKLDPERQQKRTHHWQQVAISACEQSGRAVVPSIHPPKQLEEWIELTQADLKLVMHPPNKEDSQNQSLPLTETIDQCALLIGPEGGLTDDEVDLAQKVNFSLLALGPRVLRTETAPVAGLSFIQIHWGDINPTK